MRSMVSVLPMFLPGLLASVAVGVLLARPVALWLGSRTWVAFLLIVSLGAVLAATLTPDGPRLAGGPPSSGMCDLHRVWFAPLPEYVHVDDFSLNVILFVPLGVALGLAPRSKRTYVLLGLAIALPVVIETTQMLATTLGRGCQSGDVFDNLLGLGIGLLLGLAVAALTGSRRPAT